MRGMRRTGTGAASVVTIDSMRERPGFDDVQWAVPLAGLGPSSGVIRRRELR